MFNYHLNFFKQYVYWCINRTNIASQNVFRVNSLTGFFFHSFLSFEWKCIILWLFSDEWEQFCKVNPQSIQPHPINCAQYYNCTALTSGEGTLLQECKYPDLFSPRTLRCDDFMTVTCGARHEPHTPCKTLILI